MNNKKGTKRALLTSVMALAMCVVMLIGTTFAWFTDTATANVNTIKSGNLHVDIVDKEGTNSVSTLEWFAYDGRPQDQILWEPGCTYTLTPFRIANTGNLALKYKIVVTGLDGDAELLDVIKFTYKIGNDVLDLNAEGNLLAGAKSEVITISAEMDKNAGNDYMDKTLENVKITVYATQYTSEFDSSTDQYDKDATYYPVLNAAGLKDALVNGGNIQLDADVTTSDDVTTEDTRVIIGKSTTLNLGDKKIIAPGEGGNRANFAALFVDADTIINASKDGGIETVANGRYGINVRNGAKLTINGGSYYGGGTAIQVQQGELTINDGFFACDPFDEPYGSGYLLNCVDAAYQSGDAKIIVKGGTFVNFNPADCKAEGVGTNFVADGYSVITETQPNGDKWYTVVKGDVTTLTPETVNNSGIYHSNKTYFLSAGEYGDFTATLEQNYKNVTFLASENAKFAKVTIQYHGGEPSDDVIGTKGDSTLTVKGFHVSGGISISSFDKNVTVEENDATFISLKTNHVADMGVQFLNNKLGVGTVEKGYGIYFVPNTTNYDLTITGNTFTGAKSHAIAVQGNGDGQAVTAAKSITVTGNNFVSYGLNGESNRAAFKIWADTALTPDPNKANDAANALANAIKTSNTFGTLGANCVVAQFDKANVAFN